MATPQVTPLPIVELRQYALRPGKREVLIDHFDREFVESQEALAISVIGQFRDIDDPDRFVWLRGFPDMATRAEALQGFYGGPVWKLHRDAANATMIDSDNVLLLRPAHVQTGFLPDAGARPSRGAGGDDTGLVIATIYSLDPSAVDDVVGVFSRDIEPTIIDGGATVLGLFLTEESSNNFPALPIREGESVFVWFAGFGDAGRGLSWSDRHNVLEPSPAHSRTIQQLQTLRLAPTARSRLSGLSGARRTG
ncbi:MAG: NIPSNAP family protein [Candidatus Dormiibacterota bacterium]